MFRSDLKVTPAETADGNQPETSRATELKE